APVHAVRGNVDHGAWSANLPVPQRIEIDGFRIYVLHILAELDPQVAGNVDAVIYGHSHQPKIETKNDTLFFNPGSAGPRRFRLPITAGRMTSEHGKLRAEIVELSVERGDQERFVWHLQDQAHLVAVEHLDVGVSRHVEQRQDAQEPPLTLRAKVPNLD